MPAEEQVCVVYAGVRGLLDKMVTTEIPKFEQKFLAHLKSNHTDLLKRIRTSGELSKADDDALRAILDQFIPESGCAMKA